MHIPKNAGTTIEKLLVDNLTPIKVRTHIEHFKVDKIFSESIVACTGHVAYHRLLTYEFKYDNLISSIRDPFKALVSHLRWVQSISTDLNSERYKQHNNVIQLISRHLNTIEWNDTQQIKKYVDNLTNLELGLFDNNLVRFISKKRVTGKVEEDDLKSAIENIQNFDFVFVIEDFDNSIIRFNNQYGEHFKMENTMHNVNPSNIDTNVFYQNEKHFANLTKFDNQLYKHIVNTLK